jgi:hypothetical protein
MHEYIEIQFRRRDKPFRVARQVQRGFEFDEPDPPTRSIDIGFAAFDDGTRYRMQRIRQVKGWSGQRFDVKLSVEDGSLVLRGDDRFSLPEGWYTITANVSGAKVKTIDKRRVEVVNDRHALLHIDLELDERTIEVDLDGADPAIQRVLDASTLDGQTGTDWVLDNDVRPTRRACALNLLASLRTTPTGSAPLLAEIDCIFIGRDDRCYARVTPAFYTRVQTLCDQDNNRVYPEGPPHAKIHEELLLAIGDFDSTAAGCFGTKGLWSFRAEGSPSLQMVIARPTTMFPMEFVDLDLDLGNPLQDVVGLGIHIGELVDGKPTNHLDMYDKLQKKKLAAPYLYYTVTKPTKK